MERRAASYTEEEEMNQRRKLLNAARRGDSKAISKLFELYQVRVFSGEQLAKVNRTSTYVTPAPPAKGKRSSAQGSSKAATSEAAKLAKADRKQVAKTAAKPSKRKSAKGGVAPRRKSTHK